MTARLRELAERLDVLAHAVTEAQWSEFSMRVPVEPKRDADCVLSQAAIELRSYAKILDAEGDGGAVAIARLFKRREGVSKNAAPEFAARTMAEWDAPEGNEYWEYVQDLYTHPARSGVVSDADVEDAAVAYSKRATDGSQDVNFHDCIRAALTHFAKGERHE